MSEILVVREADNFSRILAAHNYEVINLPLIETKVLNDLSDFEKKLAEINNYDGIFLTSAQPAQILVENLRKEKVNYGGKVYVFGKRGYEILKNENLNTVFDENANTAQEMLENIALGNLKGKRFLFMRGTKSLTIVPEFLAKIGEVEETIVYETLNIKVADDKIQDLREKIGNNKISCVCFFSPSAAESFIEQFDTEILHRVFIAVVGKTTAGFLKRQNLSVDFISSKSTAADFVLELVANLREKV